MAGFTRCEDCGFQYPHSQIRRRKVDGYPNMIRFCVRCLFDPPPTEHRCQFPGVAHRASIATVPWPPSPR